MNFEGSVRFCARSPRVTVEEGCEESMELSQGVDQQEDYFAHKQQ